MQENVPTRIVIYAKDITYITGKKMHTARTIIEQVSRKYDKKPGDLISIYVFCKYTGLKEERVKQFLSR